MQTLATLLVIDKKDKLPVYLQLSGQLIDLIRRGILPANDKMISSRDLSALLGINRVTVVRVYDELLAQGWLESKRGKGTFVSSHIPQVTGSSAPHEDTPYVNPVKTAGFEIREMPFLARPIVKSLPGLHLDDGFPDTRLAPLTDLSRAYRTQLLTGNSYSKLGYGDTKGSPWLRAQLSIYLNESRGLKTTAENILIVRGAMMGFYLMIQSMVAPSDHIILGETGWGAANMAALHSGVKISRVPIDEHGIDVDAIEAICNNGPIRMVYVTSHHHYPTTVALRADRRMKLLKLAEQHGFIVFEDDYDYEFHYNNQPLLPLAGADHKGMVIYCGSFSKSISPAFRVGYLTGPEDAISHLAQYRRIIDRQGDLMLENAMAELLEYGLIQRHLRKSMRVYKQRRDVFCELMNQSLKDQVRFSVPDGGLAVWTKFNPDIDLSLLSKEALKKGLYFSDGKSYGVDHFTRLGFASSNAQELEEAVNILKNLIYII